MKTLKFLISVAIILMIVVIMGQTVPSKERHKEVMMEAVRGFVDDEAGNLGIADNALTRIGKDVVVKAVETALNSKLKVHDYYVANTTYVKLKGEEKRLPRRAQRNCASWSARSESWRSNRRKSARSRRSRHARNRRNGKKKSGRIAPTPNS